MVGISILLYLAVFIRFHLSQYLVNSWMFSPDKISLFCLRIVFLLYASIMLNLQYLYGRKIPSFWSRFDICLRSFQNTYICYRKLPFSNGQPYSGCSTLLYKPLSSSRQPWLTMSTTTLATATTATSNKCLSTCNFKYHGVLFTFEVGCINYWHTFYQNFGFTHKNLQLPQSNGSRSNSQLELQQKLYTSVERNWVMSNIELDIYIL